MEASCNKLEQLFRACDVKGSGLIGRSEMQELCKSFSISTEDSDLIFDDLDRDGDGKINFEDFCRGFRDCINMDFGDVKRSLKEEEKPPDPTLLSATKFERRDQARRPKKKGVRRRDSMHHAFKQFSKTFGEENVLQYLGNSDEKIQQLYQDLMASDTDPGVRAQVETVLGSLINEVKRLQEDNSKMETIYIKEKDSHETHLRAMEEELEAHVARVDAQARREAEIKKESEMRSVQQKMQDEINELQMHLKMFQKVDSWINKDSDKKSSNEDALRKLEDAASENRDLKMNLTETETSIALMRAEMAQVRAQYEEKCRELHNERQQMEECIVGQQQYQRQLQLLQDANRRIQDTNDSLRQTMHDCDSSVQMRVGRRSMHRPHSQLSSLGGAGGERASLGEELVEGASVGWEAESVRSHSSRGRSLQPSGVDEVQFGIPRLMNDLDKSLKDHDEMDSGLERSMKDGVDSPVDMILPDDVDELDAQQDNGVDEYVTCTERRRAIPVQVSPQPGRGRYLSPRSIVAASSSAISLGGLEEARGPPERTYKVVFAGDAAVGKSTFITRVCKGVFLTNITSTLGVDFQVKTLYLEGKNVAIQLWDTAGQERFRSITKSYFRRADGVMLLYDVTSERSYLSVRQWIQSIDEVASSQIPIMLCANKCDMRQQSAAGGKTSVSQEQGEQLAREFGAHYQETSAKTGQGMAAAIVALGRRMVTNEDVEVQTSALKVGDDRKSSSCSATGGGGSSCRKQ